MAREARESLLQRWVGSWVELHHTASSAEISPHGEMVVGPAESRVGTYRLEAIENGGIEARPLDPAGRRAIFVPWHSVLLIQGPSREELERDQTEQVEEATPSHRRQELMDLLASAGSPTQVAVAKAAADSWLAGNPSDGDVRAARDRLPDVYPAGGS
jgi:hypothetical protein